MPVVRTMDQKKKREEFLRGKHCQWCHRADHLIVYQQKYYQNLHNRKAIEKIIIRGLIKEKMESGEIPAQLKSHIYFQCSRCHHETRLRRKNQKTITCQGCQKKSKINDAHLNHRDDFDTFLPPNDYSFFLRRFHK